MSLGTARVSALATTPVKGLRLCPRERLMIERTGVVENRRFYLIDERNRMVNSKPLGALSAVVGDYDAQRDELTLTFPGGEAVSGEVELGASVPTSFFSETLPAKLVIGPWSSALSAHVGQPLRLVQVDPARGGVDRGTIGAVSLISRASITNLERIAGTAVDGRRFRMLVEVEGLSAHEEDGWVGRRVKIGQALVLMGGHVGRCLVTSRDPDSGVADLPTLDLLRSYRGTVETTEPLAFGIYGEVLEAGVVQLGDQVVPV